MAKKGFAISVPDERINQVLAYCENGAIADTAYIEGLAMAISNLPMFMQDTWMI